MRVGPKVEVAIRPEIPQDVEFDHLVFRTGRTGNRGVENSDLRT